MVGITIGALAGTGAWAISAVAPEPFVVAAAFGATVVLSGAVHVDGFLDSCDALGAVVTPEARLAIFKDPRHGTFAVAGFAVVALWWIAALAALAPAALPWALAFAGGCARLASLGNAFALPYGRAGLLAAAFDERPPLAIVIACAGALCAVAVGARAPSWIVLMPLAAGLALVLGRAAAQRLGGVLVGDVYGAIIVVLEVVLVTVIACLQGH